MDKGKKGQEGTSDPYAKLYLENIFAADDIKKQLPLEAAKFAKVSYRPASRACYLLD